MKKVVAMICAVMVIGTATQASAGVRDVESSSQGSCGESIEPTRTFAVKVRALDDEYRIGEEAKFRVRVSRILGGQDVGPVEGVSVAVGVDLGEVYLRDSGFTDPDGRTLVKVAIKRYAVTGPADVSASARKLIAIEAPCGSQFEYEYGSVSKNNLFRVVR